MEQSTDLRMVQLTRRKNREPSSLDRKTPIERLVELADKTLLWEEVSARYDSSKERLQEQNYRTELALRKLK
jgi:hypothetical protein